MRAELFVLCVAGFVGACWEGHACCVRLLYCGFVLVVNAKFDLGIGRREQAKEVLSTRVVSYVDETVNPTRETHPPSSLATQLASLEAA